MAERDEGELGLRGMLGREGWPVEWRYALPLSAREGVQQGVQQAAQAYARRFGQSPPTPPRAMICGKTLVLAYPTPQVMMATQVSMEF